MLCERPYFIAGKECGDHDHFVQMHHDTGDHSGLSRYRAKDLSYSDKLARFPLRCGKCDMCNLAKYSYWRVRMFMEIGYHQSACTVTLTYNDDNLPAYGSGDWSDFSAFIKRLRSRLKYYGVENELLYYVALEYGSKRQRPHFHVIFFGLGAPWRYVIEKAWNNGYCKVRKLATSGSQMTKGISYTLKYLRKGFRDLDAHLPDDDPAKRIKESHRMSTRPAIGLKYLEDLASGLDKSKWHEPDEIVDTVVIGSKSYKIYGYMLNKLNDLRGISWTAQRERKEEFLNNYFARWIMEQENHCVYYERLFAEEALDRDTYKSNKERFL